MEAADPAAISRWTTTAAVDRLVAAATKLMPTAIDAIATAERIQGWMSRPELEWLHMAAQQCDTVAELGSWKGRSSYVLADAVRVRLYCVDTFAGSKDEQDSYHAEAKDGKILDQFIENMAPFMEQAPWGKFHQYESGKLSITVADHNAAAVDLPDVDMVFLDGDHSYEAVLSNIKAWLPKCRKVFAGHDLNWPGVNAALSVAFAGQQIYYATGSIWWVRMEGK